MDFGGAVVPSDFSPSLVSSFTEVSRQRDLLCGSPASLKHGRSVDEPDELDWRSLKVGRSETARGSSFHSLFPHGEQMLSFSSAANKAAPVMFGSEGRNLSYYNQHSACYSSSAPYLSNGGLYCGSSNMNMHGVLTSVRGPFTPSQWLELEHQALIYKYIVTNSPIPANLLIPIRRSLSTSGFNPYISGSFTKWGSFQLGYSGNADPEPGRCRRTDGKKWRCSRDAVADQKYCERHMNRGRHRSRKHVEGHNSQAAQVMPATASSQPTTVVSGGRSSTSLSIVQQHNKCMQPNVTNPCNAEFKRMTMNIEEANNCGQELESLSILTSVDPKRTGTLFPISKQHNPFESTSTAADFRLISSDSNFNPPTSSFSDNISFVADPKPNGSQSGPHLLRHFIDEWPKSQSEFSNVTWTDVEERHSDRTQLSISIPIASYDLSSSTCSPNTEKLALSPLHMSLGVGTVNEGRQQKGSWTPVSWEASMAGPLGEVLTNTTSTPKDQSTHCSTSSLNLLTNGWDSSSHPELSPTGVLQKFSFDSLSSSTRSSPRIENHRSHMSTGSLSDDLFGSINVNPTIPS